jgi:hypothetical protein
MEERLQNLECRLARAQRQVCWLLVLVLAVPALAAALFWVKGDAQAGAAEDADKKRTVLKAPLDIVGADGNRLMTVEEKKEGGAIVWFYRSSSKVNAIIDCTAVGGSFALTTPDQKLAVVLDSLPDGGSVSLFNAQGKEGVLAKTTSSEGTKLTLTDKDGKSLFSKP